jgi:hypothetical protein
MPPSLQRENGKLPAIGKARSRWVHDRDACINYICSMVSRKSVRIALTLAALNDLEVKLADIENA